MTNITDTEKIIINFGNNLKALRTENNLSINELSDKLGMSRQIISSYENNRKLPNLYSLIQISRFFNCSIDSLVFANSDIDAEQLYKIPNTNLKNLLKDIESIFSQSSSLLENLHSVITEITEDDADSLEK